MHEVLFVTGGVAGIAGVFFALPKEEPGDLVVLRAGVVLIEFVEHGFGVRNIVVPLLAGIPVNGLAVFLSSHGPGSVLTPLAGSISQESGLSL